jgi:hypothetical protein
MTTWEEWRKMNVDQAERHCADLGLTHLIAKYRRKVQAKKDRNKD